MNAACIALCIRRTVCNRRRRNLLQCSKSMSFDGYNRFAGNVTQKLHAGIIVRQLFENTGTLLWVFVDWE